jgi:hypothetical protein
LTCELAYRDMRRREVENENGNRLLYYEFDDEDDE